MTVALATGYRDNGGRRACIMQPIVRRAQNPRAADDRCGRRQ